MISHYIILAWRNFTRHKMITLVNIIGLSSGLFVCGVIGIWAHGEFAYDDFHEDAERIVRVTNELAMGDRVRHAASTMAPLVSEARERIAAVESGVTIRSGGRSWLTYNAERLTINDVLYASEDFFDVFTFELSDGNPQDALLRPYTIILTESTARALGGAEAIIGQTVHVGDAMQCIVSGVIADCPVNSHFQFDALVSFSTLDAESPGIISQWGRMGNYSYLKVQPGVDTRGLEESLTELVNERLGAVLESRGGSINLRVQPLLDIHLYSDLVSEITDNGSVKTVALFIAVALLTLLMAGFNFVSLSAARYATRMRELSIRKILGATRVQVICQLFVESVVVALIAAALAVGAAIVLLSEVERWLQREMPVPAPEWLGLGIVAGGLVCLALGVIPALRPSSLAPRSAASVGVGGRPGVMLRRGMVLLQFLIASSLTMAVLAVDEQISFMQGRELGFRKEGLVTLPELTGAPSQVLSTLRTEIGAASNVFSASLTSGSPLLGPFPLTSYSTVRDGEDRSELMVTIACDEHYLGTLGAEVVAGRDFSTDYGSDSLDAVIVNETAVRLFGWDNPIGRVLRSSQRTADGIIEYEKTIIGVVRDFHFKPLRDQLEPLALTRESTISLHPFEQLIVRTTPDAVTMVVSQLEELWSRLVPERPFHARSIEDAYTAGHATEDRLMELLRMLGLLAMIVAVLGLLGMIANAVEQRLKEIGIRKTFGARAIDIVTMLMRESVALSLLAVVFAFPLAYHYTNQWLAGFAYQAPISWEWIGVVAGLTGVVTAVLATGYHSAKAGLSDPIDSISRE